MPYRVLVADNFHYMDDDETSSAGEFETSEEAIAVAMKIVDSSLAHIRAEHPDASSQELLDRYRSFGDDPYIVSGASDKVEFSAWKYAAYRCRELKK